MRSRQTFPLVFAVFAIGLLLRLVNLAGESLWRDEISSVEIARLPLHAILENRAFDVHPPLYYFILHYWVATWGTSEFAVRLLSVLLGSMGLWPMYKIGALLFNRSVGILATLMLALAEFHVSYSQETKGYSLMVLLTLLSFHSFIRLIKEGGYRAAGIYVLTSELLLYTHAYGHFLVISQSAFFFCSFCQRGVVRPVWANGFCFRSYYLFFMLLGLTFLYGKHRGFRAGSG
jgi:uncharacterized membrane protein